MINKLKNDIFYILQFIGKKSILWLSINFFFSFFLAFLELLVALFLQLFLINLGLLNTSAKVFGFHIPSFNTMNVITLLFIVGFLRFISQSLVNHSNNFVLEYCNSRLKILSIYNLLYQTSDLGNDVSDANFKISEVFPKTTSFISNSVYLVSSLIQCIFILCVLFFTSWKETVLCLICLFLIAMIILKINRYVHNIAEKIPNEQKKLNQGIQKISRNLLFISITRTADHEFNILTNNIINYSSKAIRTSLLNVISGTSPQFFGIILLIFIIYLSQNYWHTSPLILISFIYLLVRFVQNLAIVAGYFSVLNTYYPQVKISFNFYKNHSLSTKSIVEKMVNNLSFYGEINEKSITSTNTNLANNNIKFLLTPNIFFENVSFIYPNSKQQILNNLNFNILPGECVGIIGSSGSGKSTILLLLLGMLHPTNGKILISNSNPKEYFEDKKTNIGYVGAEPFLIKGTIKDNLLYGIQNEVTNEEIQNALEAASLNELVDKYSLNHIISEDHSGLSAGQKQRLCLARAILNKPHLLVLDEATANLDEKTELEIALSIEKLKGKSTIVIVSHRKGILKPVDKIIDLNLLYIN